MRTFRFARLSLVALWWVAPAHAQSPPTPSAQAPAQAAILAAPAKAAPAPVSSSTPITIHLLSQPAAAQAAVVAAPAPSPVVQTAYVVSQPTPQAVTVAVPPTNPPQPVFHHPGPIRRGLGKLFENASRIGWDHVHYPTSSTPAASVQAVQLVGQAQPQQAAVFAAPAPPPVPSAQH